MNVSFFQLAGNHKVSSAVLTVCAFRRQCNVMEQTIVVITVMNFHVNVVSITVYIYVGYKDQHTVCHTSSQC